MNKKPTLYYVLRLIDANNNFKQLCYSSLDDLYEVKNSYIDEENYIDVSDDDKYENLINSSIIYSCFDDELLRHEQFKFKTVVILYTKIDDLS